MFFSVCHMSSLTSSNTRTNRKIAVRSQSELNLLNPRLSKSTYKFCFSFARFNCTYSVILRCICRLHAEPRSGDFVSRHTLQSVPLRSQYINGRTWYRSTGPPWCYPGMYRIGRTSADISATALLLLLLHGRNSSNAQKQSLWHIAFKQRTSWSS